MGKVFGTAQRYNPNPGKYSWDHWNFVPQDSRVLHNLVVGNFYAFMNQLLEFEPGKDSIHPWVPSKKRWHHERKRTSN